MATENTGPMSSQERAAIGQRDECDHPVDQQDYLGHMGSASLHQCSECEAVVVAW